jgi:hypothetical protein
VLEFLAGPDGLKVRVRLAEVSVEFRLDGSIEADHLFLPEEALADCAGREETVVQLKRASSTETQMSWLDAGVPQQRTYAGIDPENLTSFPCPPEQFCCPGAGFLDAIKQAVQTASQQSIRYALNCLQLRGKAGEVVATDGRQLLVQRGFSLPWEEDLLIPAIAALGCKELEAESVWIARSDAHVVLRTGTWTFFIPIDKEKRYPQIDQVIPRANRLATTCRLTPDDAIFLGKALPRLPGKDAENEQVTLDLNGHVAVRAQEGGQNPVVEVSLDRSTVDGPPVRLVSSRVYLARAISLGFREISIAGTNLPLVCKDASRTYLWMPLDHSSALAAGPDVVRIASPERSPRSPLPPKERKTKPMNAKPNGVASSPDAGPESEDRAGKGASLGTLIEDAESLRGVLREVCDRTTRLLVGLKRHRKQSQLFKTTLASLRQLQQIDA